MSRQVATSRRSTSPTEQPLATELACGCTRCTVKYGTPAFIGTASPSPMHMGRQLPSPVASQPTHCPTCGHDHSYRPYDYADVLCLEYWGMSRLIALKSIHLYNQFVAASDKGHYRKEQPTGCHSTNVQAPSVPATIRISTDIQSAYDFIQHYLGVKPVLAQSCITPLTIRCSTCAATYTLLRSAHPSVPSTVSSTSGQLPTYCVYCGASNCSVVQDDTEETAWLSLANHYGLTVAACQFFYDRWRTVLAQYPTLLSYLEAPANAPLVAALKSQAQPTT